MELDSPAQFDSWQWLGLQIGKDSSSFFRNDMYNSVLFLDLGKGVLLKQASERWNVKCFIDRLVLASWTAFYVLSPISFSNSGVSWLRSTSVAVDQILEFWFRMQCFALEAVILYEDLLLLPLAPPPGSLDESTLSSISSHLTQSNAAHFPNSYGSPQLAGPVSTSQYFTSHERL